MNTSVFGLQTKNQKIKMTYKTLLIEKKDQIATLWFNRPDVRNAFNEAMISEIIQAVEEINADEKIRILVLRGKGNAFCAGADLNWMKDVARYSRQQNLDESLNLSLCFYTIYTCKKPTISVVHGASIGGANGLLAACDFAIAETKTIFSLSEVKIGIIPACISPYVIKRVGEYTARELMLTGRRFEGMEAKNHRLVNDAVAEKELNQALKDLTDSLLSSGPNALTMCKKLIQNVSNNWTLKEAYTKTAEMIADIRVSDEGQEGMAAFLEKRKPNWLNE